MRAMSRPIAAALAAMLLTAGAADRAGANVCGEDTAVNADDANCLEASTTDATYTVRNACSKLGKVVAGIERENTNNSETIELTDNQAVTNDLSGLWSIKCCQAEGALCNKADAYTDANCRRLFAGSPAVADGCSMTHYLTTNVVNTDRCKICVTCTHSSFWIRECNTYDFDDVSSLRNCAGTAC